MRLRDDLLRMERAIQGLGWSVTGPKLQQLREYAQLLRHWSRRVNLIAPGDRDYLGTRHLLPALLMADLVRLVPHRVILDFGSGGGLPGIPLKIVFADSTVVLVECRRRRASFLREAVRSLGLDQVEVINERLEGWTPPNRGVDVVVTRAAAAPAKLVRLAAPCLAPHGALVTTLGPRGGQPMAGVVFLLQTSVSCSAAQTRLGMLNATEAF